MKDKGNWFGRQSDSDMMHFLRFAAVPLAALLLIAVILAADRTEQNAGSSESSTALLAEDEAGGDGKAREFAEIDGQEETSSAGKDAAEAELADAYADIDISGYTLRQDEEPGLLALVRTYCQAKEDCDPQLLASLFGRDDLTEEEIAEETARMELVKASVRRYENISCYYIEGPETDSYIVFPYFELLYRGANARMPQLTWVYVTKTTDGVYVMHEETGEDVAAYVARIGEREDVAALQKRVAEAQAEALASDEKLKRIYSGESEVVVGN